MNDWVNDTITIISNISSPDSQIRTVFLPLQNFECD